MIGRETPPLFLIADIQLLIRLAVALAQGFEEDDVGGYAYVEGFTGPVVGSSRRRGVCRGVEFSEGPGEAAWD